jgi:hypothetical protein
VANYNRWRGDAPPVQQVNTVTPGSPAATNTFTLTINGKSLTYTARTTLVSDVTAALANEVNNSNIPEFKELVATDNEGLTLLLTARVPGVPFTQTSSASGGAATLTTTTTTTSSGPNDWNIAGNWSTGALPVCTLQTPTTLASVLAAGGTLANATYYYQVTATNSNGETVGSNIPAGVTTNSGAGNQTINLTWVSPTSTAAQGYTGYKVYRSLNSNMSSAKLISTITNPATLSLSDNGIAGTNATVPGTSTAAGDDVIIDVPVSLLYNLNQNLNGLVLNSLTIPASFGGPNARIGLPALNPNGYFEYRPTYLGVALATAALAAGAVAIGQGNGPGSGFLRLDTDDWNCNITIYKTAAPIEPGTASVHWRCTNDNTLSNNVTVVSGSVSIAPLPNDFAFVTTLAIGWVLKQQTDSVVFCGSGAQIANVNKTGGQLTMGQAGFTTTKFVQSGGISTIVAGAFTTLTNLSGTVNYNSSGAISTLNLGISGQIWFTQASVGCTITTINYVTGAGIKNPVGAVTLPSLTNVASITGYAVAGSSPGNPNIL